MRNLNYLRTVLFNFSPLPNPVPDCRLMYLNEMSYFQLSRSLVRPMVLILVLTHHIRWNAVMVEEAQNSNFLMLAPWVLQLSYWINSLNVLGVVIDQLWFSGRALINVGFRLWLVFDLTNGCRFCMCAVCFCRARLLEDSAIVAWQLLKQLTGPAVEGNGSWLIVWIPQRKFNGS